MALKIEGFEDRSGQDTLTENSFGYVYFSDGSRVGYTGPLAAGDPASVFQPSTCGDGFGTYREVTLKQMKMAAKYLHELGLPKLPVELLS